MSDQASLRPGRCEQRQSLTSTSDTTTCPVRPGSYVGHSTARIVADDRALLESHPDLETDPTDAMLLRVEDLSRSAASPASTPSVPNRASSISPSTRGAGGQSRGPLPDTAPQNGVHRFGFDRIVLAALTYPPAVPRDFPRPPLHAAIRATHSTSSAEHSPAGLRTGTRHATSATDQLSRVGRSETSSRRPMGSVADRPAGSVPPGVTTQGGSL